MIKVATYNIRKCIGLDWRRRPDRIVRVLSELQPDVVALQEADRRFGERKGTLAGKELRHAAGLRIVPVGPRSASLGWHGNAILVSDSVTVNNVMPVDLPSLEPRGAIIADIESDAGSVRVVAAHLALLPAYRSMQVAAIVDALAGLEDGTPEIVLGDFNEWKGDGGSQAPLERRMRRADAGMSFHAAAPVARLDRVYFGPALKLMKSGVHRSETADLASDHLPVWASLAHATADTIDASKPAIPAESTV